MSSYIHFTEEQKQRAAAVDLEEFLRCRGEKLLSSGREKRLASDHSVTVRGNEWYDHAEERGGHAVSFVQRFYGLSYPDAVTMLLGGELGTAYPSAGERTEEPVKPFALPPANKDMRRVFAYLIKHRGIARDVVAHYAKAGLLYEDAEYHNAVFVGTDTDGVPRHAHKRSANSYGKAFRLNVEGSDPRYSFHHVGTDRSLYVFEAPIDMLSFITLYPENWQRHSYKAIYHPQIPLRCITVQVDQEFIDQYLQEISGDLEVNFSDFFKEKGKFYLPNVNHAMQSLYEYLLSMKASRITVEAKIYEIISYLASYLKENRLNEENGQPINKTDLQALAELTHYMDEHYSFNITLQTLSTIACMSESKMKKLFKSVYNMSITEYIQRKRISVAEHMLIQTDLTIAEISRIVGYSNPSRLIEIFKRYYGFTPSKYRK